MSRLIVCQNTWSATAPQQQPQLHYRLMQQLCVESEISNRLILTIVKQSNTLNLINNPRKT